MSPPLSASDSYDSWFDHPWGSYAFSVESTALIAAAAPVLDRSVLDVGCGTGRLMQELAARGAAVLGLDVDPAMLALAGRHNTGRLIQADAANISLASESMDITIAVTVLEFVTDPVAVVAEMHRITRPGGCVVIGALNPKSPWGMAHARRLKSPPWTAARFLTRAQLLGLARPYGPAGLTGVLLAPGPLPGLAHFGPLIERLAHLARWAGAFRVLTIRRS